MKKIFIFFVCLAAVSAANAQLSFGGKAGVNLATLSGSEIEDIKMKVGFHVGGLVQVPITESFIFQPELVFSTQGAQADYQYMDETYKIKLNTSYLNVPLLAKYQTASGFFAETGPQFGFLMSAKQKIDDETEDYKEYYKKLDFAWAFGVGYKLQNNLGFDARYNLGLSNIPDGEDAGKEKNSVFQIGVFYVIGSK